MIAPASGAMPPSPLRVIVDTNVRLSGIFFGGVPGRILAAWQHDHLEMVLSPSMASQVRLIISGDKHLLRVSRWGGITVSTPRLFVDRYVDSPERDRE